MDGGGVVAARRKAFLLGLIELSEPLGKGPDALTPEFLPVEYDDAAIAAYSPNT